MRHPIRSFFLIIVLCLMLPGRPAAAGDTLFQYSTIDALLAGLFDGNMTLEQLKFKGDFGLGTLNGIDGELIVLEGQAYQAAAGGKTIIPADSSRTPFAAVTFFLEDTIIKIDKAANLEALNAAVTESLPSRNLFYAIRIDTRFDHIKVRAIPKQTPPYQPLAVVAQKQVVVQLAGEGTLVGVYSPAYLKGIDVPCFHWHFVTKDRQQGGHVLDLKMTESVAKVDTLHDFTLRLPDDKKFESLDLSGNKTPELHAVEKNPIMK